MNESRTSDISKHPGATAALLVACAGILLAQLDTSVVNLILHDLHRAFDAPNATLRWFVDGYNLAYAAAILSAGGLGDRFGRRRIFAVGTAVFVAGSVACAFAPNAATLVAGRVVTGIGAALEVPATLALLSLAFPSGPARGRALGIWAAMNGLAFAIGPVVGGVLADTLGWRSAFAVAVPVGLAALVVARRVPESSARPHGPLDLAGQLLAAPALGAFAFAAMAAGSHAFALAFGWCVSGVVATVAFVWRERRARDPLVDLDLFADRPFTAATMATACMTFGMYGLLFLTPLALQALHGASAAAAGIALLPLSLTFVVTSSLSGKVAEHAGTRTTVAAGFAAMALGCFGSAFAASPVALAASLSAAGIGLGLTTGPLLGYAVSRAPHERAGIASGIGNASRMLGATLGVALVGAAFPDAHARGGALALGYVGAGVVEVVGAALAVMGLRSGAREARHARAADAA